MHAFGKMAEWLNALAWKARDSQGSPGFESLSFRQFLKTRVVGKSFWRGMEQSGSSTVSYAVGRGFESLSRIQINVVSCGEYPSVERLHPPRCSPGSREAVTVKDRSHDATPVLNFDAMAPRFFGVHRAGVAQLVEQKPSKLNVARSSRVTRSMLCSFQYFKKKRQPAAPGKRSREM